MALNVLIADDSAVMRHVISRTLQLSGVPLGVVLTASDGDECLRILSRYWVDVLFLDINMPGLDGIGVLNAIAEDHVLKDMPVIVVSAENNRLRIDEMRSAGVKAFVGKPFTPEQIRSAVLEAIGGVNQVVNHQ